jgi:hypothetical protein
MSMSWGYSFDCDFRILEILAILNGVGPWNWIERDKDAFGTYISAVPIPGVRVRIFSDPNAPGENGPKYMADFRIDAEDRHSREILDAQFAGLLKSLSARSVAPSESWD